MSIIKQYKKDISEITTTNIAFDGIKENVIMKEKAKNNKLVLFTSIFGGAALLGTALVLAITLSANNGSSLLPNDSKLSMPALARSATPLINTSLNEASVNKAIRRSLNSTLFTKGKSDEEIIQELLYQFDTIIENDNNYHVEAVASDKEEYKYKEIITFKDLLNQDNSYALYYNDVSTKEEQDDDEYEKITRYYGIAVKDNKEFNFKLELEEEKEDDETEIESTFYLFPTDSELTFTKVTSSSEIEGLESETEYSYEIVEGGKLVTSYEMSIENDPSDNEVELSVELNEKEFSIDRVIKNNETYFYVELENDITDQESEWVYKKVIDGNVVSYILIG